MRNTFWTIIAVIIIAVGGYAIIKNHLFAAPSAPATVASTTPATVTTVSYSCDAGKSIAAQYAESAITLALSDGRTLDLPQTMSGSGIRYEAMATSTAGVPVDAVFSSEGSDAYLMEGTTTTYQDCLGGSVTAGINSDTFTDQGKTFSLSYPTGLSVIGDGGGYTQQWMVNATTSGMVLAEIKIPQSYEPGTNFADATFTVGTSADPSAFATCLSYNPTGSKAQATSTVSLNGTTYTVFHSNDAAAGNRYDTVSYRTERGSQCYAVEYTIHYGVFANYPKGSVKQFDEASTTALLDGIAQSFTFLQ